MSTTQAVPQREDTAIPGELYMSFELGDKPVISEFLRLPAGQAVVCGMSLGYADPEAVVNDLGTPREAVEDFSVFWGFEAS